MTESTSAAEVTFNFTNSKRKICSTIKKSQNIMNMIVVLSLSVLLSVVSVLNTRV